MHPTLPDVPQEFMGEPQQLGQFNQFDLYPMPSYIQLTTPNPEETANWFVKTLGFGIMFANQPDPEAPPMLVHLRRRKYQDVLLVPGDPQPTAITYDASGELNALAQRIEENWQHSGITTEGLAPPMLSVTDPDGNKFTFFDKPSEEAQQRFHNLFDQT
ncbi:hypothetical protein ATL17_0875 [Maritalea mobilis]|uniref:VOC domain-containing protein n=1 Tax=Maritalea mobilis TaxID=483324 RepID=A0A4R6VS58_9HYPH|nr:VOC family protein [Maritalea mobilis]TDQ66869.1 hypothetical protein ATL17_0875 [Maritalea mobilis]